MAFISLDGGGTKVSAILFDENMNQLGKGISGGVNLTQTSAEESRAHMVECIDQLFSEVTPAVIDVIYGIFVGPFDTFLAELEKRVVVKKVVRLGEAAGCLLAGGLLHEGLLALSGTGSDVFYVSDEVRYVVGGWGPVLGDQGSGTWIGQQALRAHIKAQSGWGQATLISDILKADWQLENNWDLGRLINKSSAPFRKAATATHVVSKAAAAGDQVALDILKEAGDLMARQMIALLTNNPIPQHIKEIFLAGGAWKTHPAMLASFTEVLQAYRSDLQVKEPWFEPTMAGVAHILLDRGHDRQTVRQIMAEKFPEYEYNKQRALKKS